MSENLESYEIENYYNINGYNIFYRIFGGNGRGRAFLYIHGKGGHCGYLENIISDELLREANFYALDLPGFGNSSGRRGHIDSFETYIKVIDRFVRDKIVANGAKELYIIGESMGSLLAFYYANESAPEITKGVIFMPGIYHVKALESPLNRMLLSILNLVAPELNIKGRGSIKNYTNNEMFWELLENDPFWVRDKSVRLICEIGKYLSYLHKHVDQSKVPLLIFHGADDLYNSIMECTRVFARVNSRRKNQVSILEHSNHWLIIDSDLEEIRSVIKSWCYQVEGVEPCCNCGEPAKAYLEGKDYCRDCYPEDEEG